MNKPITTMRDSNGNDIPLKYVSKYDKAKDKADEYLERAKATLPASLPEEVKEAYVMVADFIGDRDY